MTGSSPPARDRWLRAIGYGLLAEITTVVTIIAIVMAYRYATTTGRSVADYTAFGERVGGIVGIIGGTIYTFMYARLVLRRVSARFIAHGVVVAVAAIALSVAGSIAGHQAVPAGYVIASFLKLAAGIYAGYLAAERLPASAP